MYICYSVLVVEWVPEAWISGTHSTVDGEMGSRQVEHDFSSFFAKFLAIFDDNSAKGTIEL